MAFIARRAGKATGIGCQGRVFGNAHDNGLHARGVLFELELHQGLATVEVGKLPGTRGQLLCCSGTMRQQKEAKTPKEVSHFFRFLEVEVRAISAKLTSEAVPSLKKWA